LDALVDGFFGVDFFGARLPAEVFAFFDGARFLAARFFLPPVLGCEEKSLCPS
jgi:hypothetical protein